MQAMNEHWEFWHVSNISRDLESSSVRVVFLPIAAAAAKSLQSCPTVCDSIDGSPSGSPSLGFSRQEHWSGLPFPSPMQESEKWKGIRSVVSDSSRLHGLQPTRLLCPWDFSRQEYRSGLSLPSPTHYQYLLAKKVTACGSCMHHSV